ncbi:MAG: tRNA uridine-5-carboxymethylaminomethyl(34) synthesis GTPase MnmE, partial [Fibrobacterota bacterium]
MMKTPLSDTIAAAATPPGEGGLAVIRISGRNATEIAARVFKPARPGAGFQHQRAVLGRLLDNAGDIDTALALFFSSPRSYTGEDTVELSLHGGPILVRRTLEALRKAGARPAEPGEFTRRAFLNGKMDLVQAESVASLIRAETESAQRAAQTQLEGGLSRSYRELRETLMTQLALVETNIDFAEEDVSVLDRAAMAVNLKNTDVRMEALLASYETGRLIVDGAHVAIVGPPNAGKSSLMNALCEKERVIVDAHPGTTRDLVEETMALGGMKVTLMDTAGLRKGRSRVESKGIERAQKAAAEADLALIVLDVSVPLSKTSLKDMLNLPCR